MCFAPQWRAIFRHLTVKKWPEPASFLAFWLTNVLRATAACHFFRIATSKMAPKLRCFVHFDLQMCFAPQRRAIFPDRNFQSWGVLYILTYKCASRHSGVQFFITPLSSYLRTRRFYEATFRTAGTTNHWKNTAIRDVANISRTCIFSPDCCTTWLLLYTAFLHDLTAVVHCFSTLLFNCPYCRKLVL